MKEKAKTTTIAHKSFHAKREPTQGWIQKSMHEIDTCYRDVIGDEEDENFDYHQSLTPTITR